MILAGIVLVVGLVAFVLWTINFGRAKAESAAAQSIDEHTTRENNAWLPSDFEQSPQSSSHADNATGSVVDSGSDGGGGE